MKGLSAGFGDFGGIVGQAELGWTWRLGERVLWGVSDMVLHTSNTIPDKRDYCGFTKDIEN